MQSDTKPLKRGNFLIDRNKLLGSGSFASTYLATAFNDQSKLYACKIIKKYSDKGLSQEQAQTRSYLIQRLQEEVKAWKALEHPNVVRFQDIIESQTSIYMILEYCDEGDLEKKLQNTLKLPQEQAMAYCKELLVACTYLYEKAIIHRDLKPANVLIKGGHLKISDFGLAKIINKEDVSTLKTWTVAGSPYYMAPEVLRGDKYNISCDVWSLGVMMYRLLLGHLPFNFTHVDKSNFKLLERVDSGEMPGLNKLSPDLQNLLQKMLDPDCRQRIKMPQALALFLSIKD